MSQLGHTLFSTMLAFALAANLTARPEEFALIDRMPRQPQPWLLLDWREKAREFDRLAFDENAAGEYLPLVRVRERGHNIAGPAFGLPTFVGAPAKKNSEALTALAAVAGGLLVGIDKSNQHGRDWVGMCLDWFSPEAGVVVNNATGKPGNSFWYDLFSSVLFFELTALQPKRADLNAALLASATHWRDAIVALGAGEADFNHTAFRFASMTPHNNGKWREPDAAAGLAWMMYAAWKRTDDPKFLEAARWCMDYLEKWDESRGNPGYEVLHYFAPVIAARLNLEAGGHYTVGKMLAWTFSENLTRPTIRPHWGMIAEAWGGYDVHGLLGSTRDGGGYAFAMNTFHAAAALAPVVRYQPEHARAFGLWLLNLANNARLFYPEQWPADRQSSANWRGSPNGAIAYEGLRKQARVLAPQIDAPAGAGSEKMRWDFKLPDQLTQATGHFSATDAETMAPGAFVIECDEGAGFREVGRWPRAGSTSDKRPTVTFAVSAKSGPIAVRARPASPTARALPEFQVSIRCFLATSPFATGDPQVLEWGSATDLGLYGSAHVGFLAAVVEATNVPGTVRANVTATDFFGPSAHATWLYYNPLECAAKFSLEHAGAFDLYDAVTHRFIVRGASGQAEFELKPDTAAVVVVVPAGAKLTQADSHLSAEGVVIDYHTPFTSPQI